MNLKIAGPITLALVYRSYSHSSLTLPGILVATLTALIHAAHPSPLPFTLLVTFFLLGTTATKVKKDVKASLTLSSTGHRTFGSSSRVQDWFGSGWNKHRPLEAITAQQSDNVKQVAPVPKSTGGQEPRSATQVLANSVWSSFLCLLHLSLVGSGTLDNTPSCFGKGLTTTSLAQDLILVGIISNYAAVTADTLSSELGILSSVRPRHILTFREVPPGTNGGITGAGLFSGLFGALIIGVVSVLTLPDIWNWTYCLSLSSSSALDAATAMATGTEGEIEGDPAERAAELFALVLAVGSWGALGSVLDSILGACLQASVVDRRSGKVVEATNGGRVLISSGISSSSSPTSASSSATSAGKRKQKVEKDEEIEKVEGSRILGSGRDILDNNQVNLLMAGVMTLGGMIIVGRAWEVDVLALLLRGIGIGGRNT